MSVLSATVGNATFPKNTGMDTVLKELFNMIIVSWDVITECRMWQSINQVSVFIAVLKLVLWNAVNQFIYQLIPQIAN